jgi:O-antigen ligase
MRKNIATSFKGVWRNVEVVFILLPLVASLINSPVFGSDSLFAWFFYMIFSAIAAGMIFIRFLFFSKHQVKPPTYVWLFLLFVVYIVFHGLFKNSANFVHYYWISNALLFSACYFLCHTEFGFHIKNIYKGIVFFALLESLVIFLQCLTILPVKNNSFLCTGTWVNPNVTAMFLSLSLFALLQIAKTIKKNWLSNSLLFIVVLAILLLYCRTAYLVAFLFVVNHYKESIKILFRKGFKFNIGNAGLVTFFLICFLIFLSPFLTKQESLNARTKIWQNSLRLTTVQPLSGFGFGKFEKEYNFFTANLKNDNNSHINMAYNDFLELTIEGGIPALALWVLFLFSFTKFCRVNSRSLLPIFAILIIQLTNFGFQAIPVMALFIIYAASGSAAIIPQTNDVKEKQGAISSTVFNPRWVCMLLFICTSVFFIRIVTICGAYFKQKRVHDNLKNPYAVFYFKKIEPILSFSNGFYENYGDAFMARKQFIMAAIQYEKALETCSRPNVFAKCGYSYRMLKNYDSSKYYCQIVQDMEPDKLIPRMALLQLYQQMGDTIQIQLKAKEIIQLPMRVITKRGIEIKKYAKNTIAKIDSINNITTN